MASWRSRPRARAAAPTTWLVLALAAPVLLAGCGGDDPDERPSARAVGPEVQECREQWQALAREVDETLASQDGSPSDLRPRWVTVTAQVGYYATSGQAGDCETTLEQERATIEALQAFSTVLAPLDVERLLGGYERDRLASYTRPSGREGRGAPSEAAVADALDDLRRLAPQVTADQAAGWQQAAVTDLTERAARDQAVADLRVLSGESEPYLEVRRIQRVLDRAARATD